MGSRRDDGWTEDEMNLRAEGYECKRCGRTPTYAELDNGFCPCKKEVPTKKKDKVP